MFAVTTCPLPCVWSASMYMWYIRLYLFSSWPPFLLLLLSLYVKAVEVHATWDNSTFSAEVETLPARAHVSALPKVDLHFHLTLYTFMPPLNFTINCIWMHGAHPNSPQCLRRAAFTLCYCRGDKTNWTCLEPCYGANRFFFFFFSPPWEEKKNPRGERQIEKPAAPGHRAITECFGQGVEIAATPLHSLPLSASHWLWTWATLIRWHLWQGPALSHSSTFI